jgi:hypothetical protein
MPMKSLRSTDETFFYDKEQNATFLKCCTIRISELLDVGLKEFCCIFKILMLTFCVVTYFIIKMYRGRGREVKFCVGSCIMY